MGLWGTARHRLRELPRLRSMWSWRNWERGALAKAREGSAVACCPLSSVPAAPAAPLHLLHPLHPLHWRLKFPKSPSSALQAAPASSSSKCEAALEKELGTDVAPRGAEASWLWGARHPHRHAAACRLRLRSPPFTSPALAILDALKAFAKGLFALCQNQQPPKAAPH